MDVAVQTTKRRFRTVVITGGSAGVGRVTAKRLELLNEVIPSLHRAGVLLIRDSEINGPSMELMEERGKALGVELAVFEAHGPVEFEGAFARWTNGKIGAIVVGDHAFLVANSDAIAALAAKHRLPSIGPLELAQSADCSPMA
jgi:NAD(P)-dependent dehydrogenase (short-subunit alcohol dehydrogenase family)